MKAKFDPKRALARMQRIADKISSDMTFVAKHPIHVIIYENPGVVRGVPSYKVIVNDRGHDVKSEQIGTAHYELDSPRAAYTFLAGMSAAFFNKVKGGLVKTTMFQP